MIPNFISTVRKIFVKPVFKHICNSTIQPNDRISGSRGAIFSSGFDEIRNFMARKPGNDRRVHHAYLNSRISKVKLNRSSVISIVLCVGGVGLFVLVAAFTAVDKPVTAGNLVTILIVLAVVLVLFAVAFIVLGKSFKAIAYIVGAGVLYGFVATLAKVLISRLFQGQFDALTILALIGLIAAFALGGYFVQNAYSSGPPDLVIAGLTVIDPLVAVGIGILVLGEASQAPVWALFAYLAFGAVAILGVFGLARYHPQAQR